MPEKQLFTETSSMSQARGIISEKPIKTVYVVRRIKIG